MSIHRCEIQIDEENEQNDIIYELNTDEPTFNIDALMNPLLPMWDALETECTVLCCGIDAFCFFIDGIRENKQLQNYEELVEMLATLKSQIEKINFKSLTSNRLGSRITTTAFIELIDHLIETFKKIHNFNQETANYLTSQDPLSTFRKPINCEVDIQSRTSYSEFFKQNMPRLNLSLFKEGISRNIYVCSSDGSFWGEEFPFSNIQGKGPSCFYYIDEEDPKQYIESNRELITLEIRTAIQNKAFWDALPEGTGEACRKVGCERNSLRFSVFCKKHHYEDTKKEPAPSD